MEGLGEAVRQLIVTSWHFHPFQDRGLPDEHTVTGSQQEIFQHYGIDGPGLAATARKLLSG